MNNLLIWVQIIVSILLVVAILLQQKGVGLGSAFGGSGQIYRTRRGIEKWLFWGTIILAVIFVLGSLATLIIR
ncbi:preprotein translocase subunit SecG [Candidatus Giovannonibacteria bacterium]|nr:preprotein translocase subunit SecG [Candidatus Giovannonibacteria bacterium]